MASSAIGATGALASLPAGSLVDFAGSAVNVNQATGGSLSGNTFNEVGVGTGLRRILAWSSADGYNSAHGHTINLNDAVDAETRPINLSCNRIIKY